MHLCISAGRARGGNWLILDLWMQAFPLPCDNVLAGVCREARANITCFNYNFRPLLAFALLDDFLFTFSHFAASRVARLRIDCREEDGAGGLYFEFVGHFDLSVLTSREFALEFPHFRWTYLVVCPSARESRSISPSATLCDTYFHISSACLPAPVTAWNSSGGNSCVYFLAGDLCDFMQNAGASVVPRQKSPSHHMWNAGSRRYFFIRRPALGASSHASLDASFCYARA